MTHEHEWVEVEFPTERARKRALWWATWGKLLVLLLALLPHGYALAFLFFAGQSLWLDVAVIGVAYLVSQRLDLWGYRFVNGRIRKLAS